MKIKLEQFVHHFIIFVVLGITHSFFHPMLHDFRRNASHLFRVISRWCHTKNLKDSDRIGTKRQSYCFPSKKKRIGNHLCKTTRFKDWWDHKNISPCKYIVGKGLLTPQHQSDVRMVLKLATEVLKFFLQLTFPMSHHPKPTATFIVIYMRTKKWYNKVLSGLTKTNYLACVMLTSVKTPLSHAWEMPFNTIW